MDPRVLGRHRSEEKKWRTRERTREANSRDWTGDRRGRKGEKSDSEIMELYHILNDVVLG